MLLPFYKKIKWEWNVMICLGDYKEYGENFFGPSVGYS